MLGRRCRHAFEYAVVHGNGDVVCSIIDGRGDFVIGNVHQHSLQNILAGPRAQELRRLVLSTGDQYCAAVGRHCALKTLSVDTTEDVPPVKLRYLAIEPTSACDLRCLSCPVRDFSRDVTWRDSYRDGGLSFFLWDSVRRSKQHVADWARHTIPGLATKTPEQLGRRLNALLRGRVSKARNGTLPIEVIKRVVEEAGPDIERVDFFQYGEPFLYRHLVEGLSHVRQTMPSAQIAISTDGMQLREPMESTILDERLLDWVIFSIDGCDEESYARYRIRGRFESAFDNLVRFNRRARDRGIQVSWQYVVFRWNDRDDQFRRAIAMAEQNGLVLHFDFAFNWGRSRRRADDLRYLTPYLKPFTALPGEERREGW